MFCNKSVQILLFQSTPSVGRATNKIWHTNGDKQISIHALRGEGDTTVKSET